MVSAMSLGDSLLVSLLGIVTVFVGLVILIGLIVLVAKFTQSKPKEEKAPAAPAVQPAPAPVAAHAADDTTSDQRLIAVLSAAIAAAMEDNAGFTVRRVRRVSHGTPWGNAGREDQILSRL